MAGAPLLVAGVLLALALATLAATRQALKRPPPPPPADLAPALLLAEASRQVRAHKGSTLLVAALAGLVAGLSEK